MTLDDWLAFARQLDAVYQAELGRSCFSDPQAFVNWAGYHWRENGQSLDWIRDRIRESEEWKQRHPSEDKNPSVKTPRILRVTNESDGVILNRGYSYWPASHVSGNSALTFCGTSNGPAFFITSLVDGVVTRVTGAFPNLPGGTTEGWYWDRDGRLYFIDGVSLKRQSPPFPYSGNEIVATLETLDSSDHDLWQCHSSEDGLVHCGTIRRIVADGAYPKIGTVLFTPAGQYVFEARKELDESHVTKDGRFLVIEEGNDNRIVSVETLSEHTIPDADGAASHIDVGSNFIVGEDNQSGACVRWDLDPIQKKRLFDTWALGHVSVQNGRCLVSDARDLYFVDLDTGQRTAVLEHHSEGDPKDYDYQVRANLDPSGRVATYVAFKDGRHDLYLVVLP